jgi:hypothetical protein
VLHVMGVEDAQRVKDEDIWMGLLKQRNPRCDALLIRIWSTAALRGKLFILLTARNNLCRFGLAFFLVPVLCALLWLGWE